MASRVCARSILGLRTIQNGSRPMSTAVPPTKIDPNYISSESIDIEALFLSKPVRSLLRQLTGFDINRIFAKKRHENHVPTYKLVTDAELKEQYANAMRRGQKKLQMPPVMRKRLPSEFVLRKDHAMQGLETAKYIFTDISFGYADRSRPIVVREPDGKLRTATWEERERMLQTYLTRPEKEFFVPPMFTEPHLTNVLDKKWYEFVLDRACVQFEPDDEYYIGVTQRVYDHINDNHAFEDIYSTRHFGPMSFYYAVTKKGDALVLHLLKSNRLDDAAAYVRLLHVIHPKTRSAELVSENSSSMDLVEAYIKLEAQMKTQLDLALQSYHDLADAATA